MPRKQTAGRAAKSGLPDPIPGEAFSLIGTLRRTTKTLTVEDVAQILVISKKAVYAHIHKGLIPLVNTGVDVMRIDPKAWLQLLEHDNRHLVASGRPRRAA